MEKKILITGGMGFVGQHLAEKLSGEVYITGLENEKAPYILDICDSKAVENFVEMLKPDIIYHLAGQSSVALSWKNPQLTVDVNIKGCINLLEAVRKYSPDSTVLLVGSSEEYGFIGDKPVNEKDISNPQNIYAVSKYSQEMLGQIYHKAYGLKTIMTRSFNHIGIGQSDTFVVADFCNQVAGIEKGLQNPVIKTGNIDVMRDFTDVDDIVNAYILLADKGKYGEVYNVGSGKALSLRFILDTIINLSTAEISVEKDPERFRPSDVMKIQADISKIQADTGWKPLIPIEKSIENILNYWRKYADN